MIKAFPCFYLDKCLVEQMCLIIFRIIHVDIMQYKEYLERHFFDRFVENYKNLPFGTVIKSESADFLIETDNETIGKKAAQVILLLIEGVVPESWFDKIEVLPTEELRTDFDKIFIFRNLTDEILTPQ